MPQPISTIPNLGPATEGAFAKVGIADGAELRELGADAAYARLLESGVRPHFIGYYALVLGLQGRPWTDCRGAEKDALRLRFDRLKAERNGASGIEAILDEIGVRASGATR